MLVSFYELDKPGLDFDEADVVAATQSLQLLHPTSYPMNVGADQGSVACFLAYPFFILTRSHFIAIRISMAVFGFLTLVIFQFLCRRFFGRMVALLSLSLLSTHPWFILGTRQGAHHGILLLLFTVSFAALILQWWHSSDGPKRTWFFLLAFLCLGLGEATISWLVYWISALTSASVFYARRLWPVLAHRIRFYLLGSSGAFVLGAAPLLAYWWTRPILSDYLAKRLLDVHAQYGAAMYYQPAGWGVFRNLLDSIGPVDMYSPRETVCFASSGHAFSWFAVCSWVWIILRRPIRSVPFALALFLMVGVYLTALPMFGLPSNHFLVWLPWVALLMALAVSDLAGMLPGSILRPAFLAGFLGLILLPSIATDYGLLSSFIETGGVDASSGASWDLAQWLRAQDANDLLVTPTIPPSPAHADVTLTVLGAPHFVPWRKPKRPEWIVVPVVGAFSSGPRFQSSCAAMMAQEHLPRPLRLLRVFGESNGRPAFLVFRSAPTKA